VPTPGLTPSGKQRYLQPATDGIAGDDYLARQVFDLPVP
jgi:hypothetical protein